MLVVCPNCNFSTEVDPAKIPAGAKKATCPRCHQKFDFNLEEALKTQAPPPLEEEPAPAAGPPPASPGEPFGPEPATGLEAMAQEMAGPGAEAEVPPAGIPWEPRQGSFFGDLWATAKTVLFHPVEFYARMPITGGKKRPLAFAVVVGTIGMIFPVFWQVLLGGLFGLALGGGRGAGPGFLINLVATLILAPIMFTLGLYIISALTHFLLFIFRAHRSGFEATFRVLAYCQAGYLFNIVPLLGWLVAPIWITVLEIIGLSRAHGVSVLRIILALFLPAFVAVAGILLAVAL